MPASTPEQLHQLFVEYFNEGELNSIISLYELDATFVPFPGDPVNGVAAIREVLKGFLALKGHMQLAVDKVFRTDDLALLFSSWTLAGPGPDGTPLEMAGQTSDVARRQPDGSWMFVIDNPQGAAATK